MPNYLIYQDDVEMIAPNENETKQKIIDVMTEGMQMARQKYGRSVRIPHAKAHALLKGELIIQDGLPLHLAQGLFVQPLDAVGVNSEKSAFYGHPVVHPASEQYYSQVPYRYVE